MREPFGAALAFLFLSLLCATAAWAEPPPLLWSLDFEGNTTIPSSELKEAVASVPSSHLSAFFGFLFGGRHPFDSAVFQLDVKRLEHLYRRKGFHQATARASEIASCGEQRVCVHFRISEGAPTRLAFVNVQPAELTSSFKMKTGDVFDHDRYLAQKAALLKQLKEDGYPKPTLTGDAVYEPRTNTVELALTAKPGTRATVSGLSFTGLRRIRSEDALLRVPVDEIVGHRYDPKLIDETQSLLSGLDVFNTIDPQLNLRTDRPELVDVNFAVAEKPLRTYQFGGGVQIENSRQELKLLGEWTDRNWHNHLRTFDVRLEPKYAVLPSVFNPQGSGPFGSAEVSVKQPGFLSPWQDSRTAVGFDSDLEQGFGWYGPKFSQNFDRHLTHQLTFSWGYNFRYLTFYDVSLVQAASSTLVPAELLFTRNYRLGFVSELVRWDLRDDLIEPHHGSYLALGLQESSQVLGSGFTYFRFAPDLRHYIALTGHATLAAKVYYGRIIPLIGEITPITERYYGGGANDHRGFSYRRLSPQVLTTNGTSQPIGGTEEVLLSAELRYELFQWADRWVIGALFVDAGDVVEAPTAISWPHLHYAVGPGIRYNSQFGMIRGDVGFRVTRLSNSTGALQNPDPDQLYAIHVSFGEAF